jgi:hypothetical protein
MLLVALLAGGGLGLQEGLAGCSRASRSARPANARGGVGLDLGAIQRDQAQAHHPSDRAQLQRLDQQPGQACSWPTPNQAMVT